MLVGVSTGDGEGDGLDKTGVGCAEPSGIITFGVGEVLVGDNLGTVNGLKVILIWGATAGGAVTFGVGLFSVVGGTGTWVGGSGAYEGLSRGC